MLLGVLRPAPHSTIHKVLLCAQSYGSLFEALPWCIAALCSKDADAFRFMSITLLFRCVLFCFVFLQDFYIEDIVAAPSLAQRKYETARSKYEIADTKTE